MVVLDNNKVGITLIEMVLSLSILGIMGLGIGRYIRHEVTGHERIIKGTRIRQDVRSALSLITTECKMAGYNPCSIQATWIQVDTDSLSIAADINGDGDIEDENERILYFFKTPDSTLVRRTINSNIQEIVLEHVKGFTVEGRDKDNRKTNNPRNIEKLFLSIAQRLEVQNAPEANDGFQSFSMNATIKIRNVIK